MIKLLKIINKKKRLARRQAGMTYVELIVVLAIFGVMSAIVMYNYGEFQAKVDIKTLASDIALKIVGAQKSAMSGVLPLRGYDETWKPSYGVYFDSTTTGDNKSFIYFVDLGTSNGVVNTQNSFYDVPGSCPGGECLDKILITKNNSISKIEKCVSVSSIVVCITITTPLSITFRRPDSSAIFYSNNSILDPKTSNFAYIQITVASPRSDTATAKIKVYPSGRVQVN